MTLTLHALICANLLTVLHSFRRWYFCVCLSVCLSAGHVR